MSGTDIVTVGRALPKLASVESGNGRYDVRVTWAEGARAGRTDTVDLAPMIFTFKVFKPLRDGAVTFDTVRLGDYGASIVWPENEDLDIGADAIEEMATEIMTNADFSAFLKRNKLTLNAAAAHLGIARRLVAYYAKEREIPRYIALACRQLDLMLGEEAEIARASTHHLVPKELSGLPIATHGRVFMGGVSVPTDHMSPTSGCLFSPAVMSEGFIRMASPFEAERANKAPAKEPSRDFLMGSREVIGHLTPYWRRSDR